MHIEIINLGKVY